MCGIIGYIGKQPAAPILIDGLKRLEYRGYDSAGIATIEPHESISLESIRVHKQPGKIAELENHVNGLNFYSTIGIGHTRWATHGEPTERNAHPHSSRTVAVVHNGIIENHDSLRKELMAEKYVFESDTDTEVLPHLIDRELAKGANDLESAVIRALMHVEGAYAVAVISDLYPNELVAACNSSPLVVGIGTNELYVASDELALAGKVSGIVHVHDGEVVTLKRNGVYAFHHGKVDHARVQKPVLVDEVGKSGHAHYMHKEIHEQPQTMRNVLAGRFRPKESITFGGFDPLIESRLADARRMVLVGCGTSLFAAMIGKLALEQIAGVMCEVEQAAEFTARAPALSSLDVVVGISQSGETADTLLALEYAKEQHALLIGITNRVGSALSRRARKGMYLHAEPEIAVASTKAFTAQATLLVLFALRVAQLRGRPLPEPLLQWLPRLSSAVAEVLAQEPEIKAMAKRCATAQRIIVIGRGYGVPLAYEAALKIREVAYVDAHGLSAAELKHGTLALVEKGTPVVALMPTGPLRTKMASSIAEVRARGAEVMVLEPPVDAPDELVPILLAPAVQLLAYHLGVARGVDVDQPRNLAKSVTVE